MDSLTTELIDHLISAANLSPLHGDIVNHFFRTDNKQSLVGPFARKWGLTRPQVLEERKKVVGRLREIFESHRITCVADVI